MEDDIEILEKAFLNLESTETHDQKSEFEGLYKNWGKLGSQEERRTQLLVTQKANRHNKIDRFRGILELVNTVEYNSKILFKPYKKVPYRPNIYVAGFNKTSLTYSNVMMMSEWMIEKPSDFEKNWFVVPCPKGVRVLVVANNGKTKFYTKYGHFKFERCTGLPGGNPYNVCRKNCCVLDGFYYELSNTLYILDLLAWNQPMTDGETEFRYYWMQTQLESFPDLKVVSDRNQVIIKTLPMMPCTNHYLTYMLGSYPQFKDNVPPLDGLLFYHKKAHYVAGQTPLVGWLYPYMVPEVIDKEITIHPGYLAEKPADYINQADFIQKFEELNSKKQKRWGINKDKPQNDRTEKMATDSDNRETQNTDEAKESDMDLDKDVMSEKQKNKRSNKCKIAGKAERVVTMDAEDEKSDAAKATN